MYCQGTISAGKGSINLNGGVTISAAANVNLGNGALSVNDALSGISAGSLTASCAYLGSSGTGTFTQSGGVTTLIYNGALYLGYNSGSNGTYNLSGAGVLSTGAEYVGYTGVGTFNQQGGTINPSNYSTPSLYLGYNIGSSGSYNLSGQGVLYAGSQYVGYSGNGAFTQSSGTNSVNNGWLNLYVGYNVGSSGSYNLNGSGVLCAGNWLFTGFEYVGYSGNGTFTQSGGTNSAVEFLYLGYNAGSAGSYILSGSAVLSAATEYVGVLGMGTMCQSGGTNTVSTLSLGGNGTVDLSGGALIVGSIQGSGGTFNLGGGTLVASAGFSSSQAMALTGSGGNGNISTGGNAVTLSGALSGPGGLNQWGAGTLTLAGSNTYSGGTTVSAGTLQIGSGASGEFLASPSVSLSSGAALVFNHADALTYGGLISGSGSLTKAGTGSLTLNGSNTYSGGTTVSAGTLQIGNGAGGEFLASPSVSLNSGAALVFNHADALTYGGLISGSGSLTKAGTGILTLTANNLFSGSTTISAGTLQTAAADSQYGALGCSSSIVVNGGGTLLAAGYHNSLTGLFGVTPITVNAGGLLTTLSGFTNHLGGVLTLAGGTLGGPAAAMGDAAYWGTWNLDNNVIAGGNSATSCIGAQDIALAHPGGTTFTVSAGAANGIDLDVTGTFYHSPSSQIGDFGLIKAGAGVMQLDGVNTYTGPTVINGGGLVVGVNNAVPSGSAVTVNGTFNVNGYADTIGSLAGNGDMMLGGGTLIVGNDNTSTTFSGLISGAGSLSKIGFGMLTISGTNSSGGAVAVSGGTLNQSGGLNSVGCLNIANGGCYQFGGGTLQVNGGLVNQGVFSAIGNTGLLNAVNSIVDLSTGSLQDTGSMSVAIGANSLLLVPAGFNPATAFGSYGNLGLTHTVGTTLTIAAGQGFSGIGSIADHVNCQGTISATAGGSIDLDGGVTVSGTGCVSLGQGFVTVNDNTSGMTGGLLSLSCFNISNNCHFQFSGGTLQINGAGLANQGVFNGGGGTGTLSAVNSIVDFSTGSLQNTASMSLAIGPNALLLVPAGFNPAAAFGGYTCTGLMHNVGTPLTVAAGQGFSGIGSIADPVSCEGTILAATGGSINLNGGVTISAGGSVDLGAGSFTVSNTTSGISAGSLSAANGYVGYSSAGTFTLSGGTNSLSGGNLYLGYNSFSNGNYNLSGWRSCRRPWSLRAITAQAR